jgi:hypothetical protein
MKEVLKLRSLSPFFEAAPEVGTFLASQRSLDVCNLEPLAGLGTGGRGAV